MIKDVSTAGRGVLVMRLKSPPEYGPYELKMHVGSGKFLLMLNVNDEDGSHSGRGVVVAAPVVAAGARNLGQTLDDIVTAKIVS